MRVLRAVFAISGLVPRSILEQSYAPGTKHYPYLYMNRWLDHWLDHYMGYRLDHYMGHRLAQGANLYPIRRGPTLL